MSDINLDKWGWRELENECRLKIRDLEKEREGLEGKDLAFIDGKISAYRELSYEYCGRAYAPRDEDLWAEDVIKIPEIPEVAMKYIQMFNQNNTKPYAITNVSLSEINSNHDEEK